MLQVIIRLDRPDPKYGGNRHHLYPVMYMYGHMMVIFSKSAHRKFVMKEGKSWGIKNQLSNMMGYKNHNQ